VTWESCVKEDSDSRISAVEREIWTKTCGW